MTQALYDNFSRPVESHAFGVKLKRLRPISRSHVFFLVAYSYHSVAVLTTFFAKYPYLLPSSMLYGPQRFETEHPHCSQPGGSWSTNSSNSWTVTNERTYGQIDRFTVTKTALCIALRGKKDPNTYRLGFHPGPHWGAYSAAQAH